MEERIPIILKNQGEKIFCVFHKVKEASKVVITLHGFASHKVGTNRSYVQLAEALSQIGISTLRFDFRGCGDSEGDLSLMTPQDLLEDLSTVITFIKEEGFSKIGLFGSSFGGFLAVHGAVNTSAVKSIAVWAPVASGPLWNKDWEKGYPKKVIEVSHDFKKQFNEMDACSQLALLKEIPFLYMRGENDEVLSEIHMDAYHNGRKGASALTRFITYPNTPHSLGAASIFSDALMEIVQWFKTTL